MGTSHNSCIHQIQASWTCNLKGDGWSQSAHGAYNATMEQDCGGITEGHSCRDAKKWEKVWGQMEWIEFWLQKTLGLSQRNWVSHIFIGIDHGRAQQV